MCVREQQLSYSGTGGRQRRRRRHWRHLQRPLGPLTEDEKLNSVPDSAFSCCDDSLIGLAVTAQMADSPTIVCNAVHARMRSALSLGPGADMSMPALAGVLLTRCRAKLRLCCLTCPSPPAIRGCSHRMSNKNRNRPFCLHHHTPHL